MDSARQAEQRLRARYPVTLAPRPGAAPDSHRSGDVADQQEQHRPPPGVAAAGAGAAVAVLAVLGVVLRLWFLAHDPLNADQAIVGLMAQAIDHGHFPAFFWGQDYGGAEPYVTAVGVAVFGLHHWVIDATPALLGAVASLVAWRLGRVLTGSGAAGAVAGAVIWVWSEVDLWSSTREYGFRGVVLVCILLAALASAHLVRDARSAEHRWWPWVLLGAAGGLGWWASPEILYVGLPAVVVAIWATARGVRNRGRSALAPLGAAAAAAVVGALPWLVASVHDGFASLSAAGADQSVGGFGYGGRLQIFFVHTLPMALGARLPLSGAWLGGPAVGMVLLALAVAVLGGGLVAAWRVPAARALVAGVACYPFVEAAMGPTYYWQDGRYGVYLVPLAVVGAVTGGYRLLTGFRRRSVRGHRPLHAAAAGAVVLCALAAASTVATVVAATGTAGASGSGRGFASAPLALTGTPDQVATTVSAALVAHHLDHAVANYWVAYDLDALSGGRVQVTPPDIVRVPSLARSVQRARTAAWLFVGPTAADAAQVGAQFQNPMPEPFGLTPAAFTAILAAHGISVRTVDVGPMVAVVPAVNVPAAWVAQHLHG